MGYQVIEPTAGSTDWTEFSVMFNNVMQGFMSLSLTNYDTTDAPSIAAGGNIEVAGSLYTFASTETIAGTSNPSTNLNYILVTTSSSSITASLTTDVPVWVPSKSGWYDSSTGVQRYIGGSATDFGGKWIYGALNKTKVQILESGVILDSIETRYYAPTLTGHTNDDATVFAKGSIVQFTSSAGGAAAAYLPVNLPEGAIMTELKGWLKSDGTRNVVVSLVRTELDEASITTLASVSSNGTTYEEITDTTIGVPTINNQAASYFIDCGISATPSGNVFVGGVRIKYTILKPLP